MGNELCLDLSKCLPYLTEDEIINFSPMVEEAHEMLESKTGLGNDALGWLDLPINYDKDEIDRIETIAEKINSNSDAFIIIGIGGSYLGARAVIEALKHSFYDSLPREKRKGPKIYFAGNNISSTYLSEILEMVEDVDFSINVISKSGTTTEPAIAFRFFKRVLEERYGKEGAKERIFITTDKKTGALRKLCEDEGYESFTIPDDIGGRYSVLTSVGLLPIKVAGIDVKMLLKGAEDAREEYKIMDIKKNDCYRYAAARHLLYMKAKTIEIIANYEPCLMYFNEWWKQLFAESHGKEHRGIFPSSVNFSTDLHSMGQYIQDGLRIFFETTINIETPKRELMMFEDDKNVDELNFLCGKTIDYVNKRAMEGTELAHNEGGVPNIRISIKELSPYYLGYMIYFFEKACAISGYLLGINPFNQEGVEDYKKNMFALLEKPGYEKRKEELNKRLEEISYENFSRRRCMSSETYN
ncbi:MULTISPECIES: glucose-6-phosphate isomerase [unclassified Clostridium]|uniref:glucose-6-phosphate isomerase n=1 Tax=unclassified Clostridium TaxID=2614128 RepID=UPI0025C18C3D|nr:MULTISPECIES: glucose-6-phosphate isomerase [unclassified Clostridium]